MSPHSPPSPHTHTNKILVAYQFLIYNSTVPILINNNNNNNNNNNKTFCALIFHVLHVAVAVFTCPQLGFLG